MALFGNPKFRKYYLTQKNFVRHHLHRKFREVFPYGQRGEEKIKAVDATLDIEHDARHQLPHLAHPLEETEAMERLARLEKAGMISEEEEEKVEEIIATDLHPGQK